MAGNRIRRQTTVLVTVLCVLLGMSYFRDANMAAMQEPDGSVIRGTVLSSEEGKPLFGILVKAKSEGQAYSTSVFTDDKGNYDFPPLQKGTYQVSVGTEWKQPVQLGASGARQDFSVQLGVGLMNQTTAKAWADLALANAKTEQEKKVLTSEETTCASACHTFGRMVARGPKSPEAWLAVVNRMNSQDGRQLPKNSFDEDYPAGLWKKNPREVEEIAQVLSNAIAPGFKEKHVRDLIVRPTGEAARAVFTEWDLPGTGRRVGLATFDPDGMIWYNTRGAIGRLNPRTNEFREWAYSVSDASFHDILSDRRDGDHLWMTSTGMRAVVRFNRKTFGFNTYPLPGRPHVGDVDSKGNFWVTSDRRSTGEVGETGGIAKIDGQTGVVTEYVSPTKSPYMYALHVDSQDNVWFTEHLGNNIVKFEPKTGKMSFYPLPTRNALPRRIVSDSKGRIWFVQSNVNKLGMIDPATDKLTEFDYGLPGTYTAYAYGIRVDKSDKIWVGLVNTNAWTRFDPETKKFTSYPLPSTEGWPRDIYFDYTTSATSLVWGNFMSSTIGRMYIR